MRNLMVNKIEFVDHSKSRNNSHKNCRTFIEGTEAPNYPLWLMGPVKCLHYFIQKFSLQRHEPICADSHMALIHRHAIEKGMNATLERNRKHGINNAASLVNNAFMPKLLSVMAFQLATNTWGTHSRFDASWHSKNPATKSEYDRHIFHNLSILHEYYTKLQKSELLIIQHPCAFEDRREYCLPPVKDKKYRTTVAGCLDIMKGWEQSANRGICCSHSANRAKSKKMWVHHFMILQDMLFSFSVTDKRLLNNITKKNPMNKEGYWNFYGGKWQDFFDIKEHKQGDYETMGSLLRWNGNQLRYYDDEEWPAKKRKKEPEEESEEESEKESEEESEEKSEEEYGSDGGGKPHARELAVDNSEVASSSSEDSSEDEEKPRQKDSEELG